MIIDGKKEAALLREEIKKEITLLKDLVVRFAISVNFGFLLTLESLKDLPLYRLDIY